MIHQGEEEQPEDWGVDSDDIQDTAQIFKIEKTQVTPRDKFILAKNILLVSAILYAAVATAYIYICPNNIEKVWDYSKVALNSLISIIIGFYFGSKSKDE